MKTQLLLFSFLQITLCSCPDGYELVKDGQCRGYYGSMTTSNGANGVNASFAKCYELQAEPVIIHNEEQQLYWQRQPRPNNPRLLLGLVCDTSKKQVVWADGSSLDYKPPSYQPNLDTTCADTWTWFQETDGHWTYTVSVQVEIFCTTQLQQVPSADGCDSFEDDAEDGACYQVGVTAENYQEAQLICQSFGADLASVHNQKENSFIRRLAVSKGALGGLYLGGTMSGKGNTFGWTDGSEWNYDNFAQGFPISGLGDCLAMNTQGTTGEWVNVDCSSKLSVACMRQHKYTLENCSSGPWKEGQIIYTPGFPYDASTPCDYIIEVDAGKILQLEVHLVEANSCCDHLVIGDNYFGGNVLANLTGYVTDKTYTTSSSNFMSVSWQPNGGVNVRGAMFAFRGV